MDADIFLRDREVEKFRRLACAALSGAERTRMLGLMADEEDRFVHLPPRKPAGESADLAGPEQPCGAIERMGASPAARQPLYILGMSRVALKPRSLPRWHISRIKCSPAVEIGTVEAPDADTAIEVAIKEYEITDREQQKRLAARRVE